jgi:DNA-binding PucR family transcriptional regulator
MDTAIAQAELHGTVVGRAFGAFRRVSDSLEQVRDLDDLLRSIAREVSGLVGVRRCSIHLRDEKNGLLRGCVGHGIDEHADADVKRSLAGMPGDGVTLELLRSKQPVIVRDARNDPRISKSTARFWRLRSMMAVPVILGDEVTGVIYLDDGQQPHLFTTEEAEVALVFARLAGVALSHAQSRIELRSRLDAAERQIKILRRTAAIEQQLSDLVLAERGLDALVQTLAQLLGKPCAVYDADNVRIATAACAQATDGMFPSLLEPPAVDDPAVRSALAGGGDTRPFLVAPLPDAGIMHRHLVAPVNVDGELWGRLLVMEHRSRFAGSDMLTLRRAATLVALHMRIERSAIEADSDACSSLAAELLSGPSERLIVERRAQRLGLKLDAPHVVALIGANAERDGAAGHFRAVASEFRDVCPSLIVHTTKMQAGVAALIQVPDDLDRATFLSQAKSTLELICLRLAGAERVAAGISTVRAAAHEYPEAHREAEEVLECIRRFGGDCGPAVLSASDLGSGRVFLATSDPESVRTFADAKFGELVRDRSKSDLVATLCCFFNNTASIRRCAAELGVHENTVRYRLTRIDELTGLSVTHNPDDQLAARLSMLVLMLQGRLQSDEAPRPIGPPTEVARRSLVLVDALTG